MHDDGRAPIAPALAGSRRAVAGGPASPPDLESAAQALVRAASAAGLTVATAESLTAGMVASTIAGVPGASAVLRGGLVVYATELKSLLAGVPEETLDAHGAVSAETAAALAEGAARRCGADLGVGLTGVAGPDLQEGKPAGTVFVATSRRGEGAGVARLALGGDRAQIRAAATLAGLEMLRSAVMGE
ncbi:CinA family protein [Dietzia sp.]|uniref:CinA family protein n=1 Tax=Dietzia sp. TaxID=1871616 RepID=UPI002FDADD0F